MPSPSDRLSNNSCTVKHTLTAGDDHIVNCTLGRSNIKLSRVQSCASHVSNDQCSEFGGQCQEAIAAMSRHLDELGCCYEIYDIY